MGDIHIILWTFLILLVLGLCVGFLVNSIMDREWKKAQEDDPRRGFEVLPQKNDQQP